ncbi:4-hydroxy-tetrahydrodipicolinate synthase [Paenibacillus sediminis]|uniref:4-hydroxy-tetrahydrodipicolinate synthase n=2 Tax=Paenibacillus sediminis TaxID=664909 RepID=A0ABS4H1U4_9BACL|nr:4-hydroxy-tetrahydrodipicolinate synthase [Paenibacillus sediminis]
MNERNLKGIFVPVVTPFQTNNELDLDSYQKYLRSLLTHEIQGLVVNGTTGEAPTVCWDEVTSLVELTKHTMKNNPIPLIVGTGTNDTMSTLKRTELAAELGADAVLIVVPYYNRPSQEGIVEHFRAVAQVGIPVIMYEVPSRTGVRITLDTARTILDMDGVIGLKDCSGNTELVSELTRLSSKPVLCGEDIYFHSMLTAGASGGILASASIETAKFLQVFRLAEEGRDLEAMTVFESMVPFIRLLFKESNPSPLKWLLARQGLIASDHVRLPMSVISSSLQEEMEQMLVSNLSGIM